MLNSSLPCSPESTDSDEIRLILIVAMGSIVSLTGVVFNSFLLISFSGLNVLRSNLIYLFLLAILDIIVEICFVLIFVFSLLWDYFHIYSLYVLWHSYIRYISTVGQVLIAASTLLIVAASFERYFCSLREYAAFSQKQRLCAVSFVFLAAIFMKGSVFVELELQYLPHCPLFSDHQLALSDITKSSSYRNIWMFWGRSILNVIIPFTLLLLFNVATLSNLKKTSKGLETCLVEHLPKLVRPTNEVGAARRRRRDASRTLAALVSIYLISNSLNMLITILEFAQSSILDSGDGWTYKYMSDLSSLLTISSTAFRLPVYYHCNRDMRDQITQNFRRIFQENPSIKEEMV